MLLGSLNRMVPKDTDWGANNSRPSRPLSKAFVVLRTQYQAAFGVFECRLAG
jgi:hypothetical protein